MKQQEQDNRMELVSRRAGRKLHRALGRRRKIGSFYLSDSTERYWCVSVRVSKRKGRYLKFEHQGTPGANIADLRASADNFVSPQNRRVYHFISPVEWARFAELGAKLNGRAADEHDSEVGQARATLDRIVGLQQRRPS